MWERVCWNFEDNMCVICGGALVQLGKLCVCDVWVEVWLNCEMFLCDVWEELVEM